MCNNELSMKIELEKEDSLSSLEIEKQKDIPSKSTYIIKYFRKKNELKELIKATQLPKSKHTLFMLEFIMIKNNNENNESLLHIKCHEIAAIHFEDYYERIYSYNDILKENKYFKALDNLEDIKEALDYVLSKNYQNSKKIFIELQNNTFKLHIMFTYFDTIKEIILNVPQKIVKDEEKIFLLPMALKEVQLKLNFLEKENKRFKNKDKKMNNNINVNNTFYEYYLKIKNEKEKKEKEEKNENGQQNNVNETYDTSNNSITSEEKKNKKIKIKKKKKKKNKEVKEKDKDKEIENNEIKFVNNFF